MPADRYLSPLKARCEAADRAVRGFWVALHLRPDGEACVKATATSERAMDLIIPALVSQLKPGEAIVTYSPAMRCTGKYGRNHES
jgi:hypothetical protein